MRRLTLWAPILLVAMTGIALGQSPIFYPAKGQSPEAQSQDLAACRNWASQQAGATAGAPASQPPARAGGRARGAAAGATAAAITGNDAGKGAAAGAVGGAQPSGARADRIAGRRARSSSRPVPRSIGQWPPACRAGAIPPSEACERETSGFRPVPARGAPAAFGKPSAYGGCPGRARPDLWPSSRPWPAMGAGEGLSGNRRCVLTGPRQPAWSCPPVFPQRPCAPTR